MKKNELFKLTKKAALDLFNLKKEHNLTEQEWVDLMGVITGSFILSQIHTPSPEKGMPEPSSTFSVH